MSYPFFVRSHMRTSLIAFLSILFIALPSLSLSLPISSDDISDRLDGARVDGRCRLHPSLEQYLATTHPDHPVGLLVHFADAVEAADLARLVAEGFDPLHTFHAIPVVHLRTTAARVCDLAAMDDVVFIQNNSRLRLGMDLTTEVINATQTWYNTIRGANGEDLGYIDGTGVTVAVPDTGVDAGHPDLDYGEKTIMNLKSDTDMIWYETENTDTSYGHGTHCAGTVAGNGDASGGARRGVAPGANLIGFGVGDVPFITNALGAMEWVYDHTRPGNNPYNIRVVTNSWGETGDYYDPDDAVTKITEKLTFENNVVVVFAAMNDGGDGSGYEGDDGTTKPHTSSYANIPTAISVAALERDGSGIAPFSSRGLRGVNETFPDIGAPGVDIWSTAPRRTLISAQEKLPGSDPVDPYYFAISGTSMATPHISGVVALLWQACPQMRVSTVHDDYSGEDERYWNNTNTRVHEAELILEAAAQYRPYRTGAESGVPENGTMTDHFGLPTDFAQGHGLIDVQRAVGIALTLSELRTMDRDGDGSPDWPEATVADAVSRYDAEPVLAPGYRLSPTDTIQSDWEGEWTRFNDQSGQPSPWVTDQRHRISIPPEAERLDITLAYTPIDTDERVQLTTLDVTIDTNDDGSVDLSTTGDMMSGTKRLELDLADGPYAADRGRVWAFNVRGRGVGTGLIDPGGLGGIGHKEFVEIMVEYRIGLTLTLDTSRAVSADELAGEHDALDGSALAQRIGDRGAISIPVVDTNAAYAQWWPGEPSGEYRMSDGGAFVVLETNVYDTTELEGPGGPAEASEGARDNAIPIIIVLFVVLFAFVVVLYYYRIRNKAD